MTNPKDDGRTEPAGPAAANGGQADHAATDELVAFLNELLEAERAGSRVTLESARAAADEPMAALMRAIQHDEARWCAMLQRHIKALAGTPSPKVGAFHGKAMAIADAKERLAFLNRGQGWVVRKLGQMLPRVQDDQLRADMAEMLESHETNIARANDFIAGMP